MWALNNHTPFVAEAGFQKDENGRSLWCVWLKATFQLRNQRSCLFTPNQLPLFQAPLFIDDNPELDLLADTDISLPKKKTDVLVSATAYPPSSKGQGFYTSSITIGNWSKSIDVLPTLEWDKAGTAKKASAQLLTPTALVYSNAFGGAAKDPQNPDYCRANPLGTGATKAGKQTPENAPPYLYYPGERLVSAGQTIRPAGLNAIPRHWPERSNLAGTYDKAWQEKRAPILPKDLSPEFWQTVATDQRLDAGQIVGQDLTLINMHPPDETTAGTFSTTIPNLDLSMQSRFAGNWVGSDMLLQTLHIQPDYDTLTLCYLGTLPLGASQNDVKLQETIITSKPNNSFRVAQPDMPAFETGQEVP